MREIQIHISLWKSQELIKMYTSLSIWSDPLPWKVVEGWSSWFFCSCWQYPTNAIVNRADLGTIVKCDCDLFFTSMYTRYTYSHSLCGFSCASLTLTSGRRSDCWTRTRSRECCTCTRKRTPHHKIISQVSCFSLAWRVHVFFQITLFPESHASEWAGITLLTCMFVHMDSQAENQTIIWGNDGLSTVISQSILVRERYLTHWAIYWAHQPALTCEALLKPKKTRRRGPSIHTYQWKYLVKSGDAWTCTTYSNKPVACR